jgi:hypothetical protein
MIKNVGSVDQVIRIVLGLALISLVFVGPKTPWGWLGLILIATALINFCPIWKVLGVNTRKSQEPKPQS